MQTIWTNHIKELDEKVQFEKSLLHSKWILNRLKEILDSMERGLDRQEVSPKAYDTPNWENKQAHANGFRQCLYTIKDLITLDHKDNMNDRFTSSAI